MAVRDEGHHPLDPFVRADSIPSVWCPGCGIGIVVHTFLRAVREAEIDLKKICIVSGYGCTGKVAEYLNLRSHSIKDGKLLNYATKLSSKKRNLRVVIFSNNADLLISGPKDFIENGRQGSNLLVIHINNSFYISIIYTRKMRSRWDSNPRIAVLQTAALDHLAT